MRAVLVAMTVACIAATLRAAELPFRHFTTENQISPLPSASVQQVMQDRLGYIWMAFYSSGIARYDGHSLEIYDTNDGITDPPAREIVEDVNGYLWVGTETGLTVSEKPLQKYGIGERLRFVKRIGDTDLVQTRIRRNWVAAHPDGSIWVATAGSGIHHYARKEEGRLRAAAVSTAGRVNGMNEPVYAIAALRDGTVVAAVGDRAVVRYDHRGKMIARYGAEDGVPAEAITVLSGGRAGRIWFGTTTGDIYLKGREGESFHRVAGGLRARVFSILELRDGTVWVVTLGGGAMRLRIEGAQEPLVVDRRSGLLSDSIWSVMQDREENLWFAQNGGLSRLKRGYGAFLSISGMAHTGEKPKLPDPSAFAVLAPEANGRGLSRYLWVGTGAGLAVLRGEESQTFHEGVAGKSIYSLGVDGSGRVWVGGVEGLTVIALPGSLPPAGDSSSRRSAEVFGQTMEIMTWETQTPIYGCRSVDSPDNPLQGSVWFSGAAGIRALVGEEWFEFGREAGLPATGATNAAVDDDGFVWVGTADRGLMRSTQRLTPESLRRISGAAGPVRRVMQPLFAEVWSASRGGAPTNSIRRLVWSRDHLWVATARGLFAFNVAPFRIAHAVGTAPPIRLENVTSIAVSPSGKSIWASHNRGLVEVDTERGTITRQVSKEDGLLDNEAWVYDAISIDTDGTIYFGTPKGLSLYHSASDEKNTTPPLLRFTRSHFHQELNGTNDLAVEFAALSFVNEAAVRYRWRLVGYDRDWSPSSADWKVRYTNLPALFWARTYELQVIASNDDGVWTPQPLGLRFSIAPPMWASWWALLIYGVFFFIVINVLNRYRTGRLERLNRALELAIDARTDQIRAQTRELETLDRIVQVINSEVTLDKLFETLLQQGLILFPQAEKAAFLIFDAQQQRCEVAAVSGYDPELFRGVTFSLEEAIRRYCEGAEMLDEGVYLIRDFSHLAGREKTDHLPQPLSMLAMEVALGGMLEGFLIFDNFSDRDAFQHSDLRKLSRFREHAVSAISKARMLRELEVKNLEAEEANRAKSAFLANMSHELRTPLNSIIGFSEILVERLEKDVQARYLNFMKLILASGQHLLTIINDILDLSKIEAGRMEVHPEAFNIRPVIEGVCTVMKGSSSKKGIQFELDIPEDLPPLEADPGKFKQILYNLLSNAVKFSAMNVPVTIAARAGKSKNGVDVMTVSITDRGIGIAPEHQKVIFDEFRQLDSTMTRRYEGTGLGLSLVKKFIDLQGGTLDLESELGKGSTFSFTLPLKAPAPQRRVADATREVVVLVSEDNRLQASIAQSVSETGREVTRANDLEETVRLLGAVRVSAVVVDAAILGSQPVLLERLRSVADRDVAIIAVIANARGEVLLAMPAEEAMRSADSLRSPDPSRGAPLMSYLEKPPVA